MFNDVIYCMCLFNLFLDLLLDQKIYSDNNNTLSSPTFKAICSSAHCTNHCALCCNEWATNQLGTVHCSLLVTL